MKSVVLAVGCNQYSGGIPNLSAAENDAEKIFDLLVKSEYSSCLSEKSFLLKSPSSTDFIESLKSISFDSGDIDVLNIFFAGHGDISHGSYYLITSDADVNKLAVTSVSLSEIFRIVSSANVKHLNLILDACHTGGLVNDLSTLIKPDLIGDKGSFGISILAAAAKDQYAYEIGDGGLLTSEIINYCTGKRKITSDGKWLDLISIGKVISTDFINSEQSQTPSSWGVNLYGPAIFTKNPFFNPEQTVATNYFSYIPPASAQGKLLFKYKEQLWKLFDELDDDDSSIRFIEIMNSVLSETKNPQEKVDLVKGVGFRFLEKYKATNSFRQLEIICSMVSLLQCVNNFSEVLDAVEELKLLYIAKGNEILKNTLTSFHSDKFLFINKNDVGLGLFGDFFYLPISISKVLGYLSLLLFLDKNSKNEFFELYEIILEHYGMHIRSISDAQAPYLYVAFNVLNEMGEEQKVKQLCFNYTLEYLRTFGRVARVDLPPESCLGFLFDKFHHEKVICKGQANPSSLGFVLLHISSLVGIEEVIDIELHLLDHKNIYAFMTNEIGDFGFDRMAIGQNFVCKCGLDFFTVNELELKFKEFISTFDFSALKISRDDYFRLVSCSFTLPNRVPYMLWNDDYIIK